MEWRLRALDRHYEELGGETGGDVRWLIHELRRSREALLGILTLCQDADDANPLAHDIRHRANQALGLYREDPQ